MKLSSSSILQGFSQEQIERLNELSSEKVFEKGSHIIEEGSKANCFYIIEDGKVAISKNGVTLATMGPGKHIGLMALIDGSMRSADAIAETSTTMSFIPYDVIRHQEHADIYQMILANQLTEQQRQLRLMNDFTVTEKSKTEVVEAKSRYYESLLKEIHHRVKNNLQTVSSLLYLQSLSISDPDAKQAILSSQQRVESMAIIHKNLYQRENLADLEMKSYITQLSTSLIDVYSVEKEAVKVEIVMGEIELNVEKAIPLGLIINELITNSLKYAFPDNRKGIITIKLERDQDQTLKLYLSDDGIGKQENPDGFGSQLVKLLTKQMEGTFEEIGGDGYNCKITF